MNENMYARQLSTEELYSKQYARQMVRDSITGDEFMQGKVKEGVQRLTDWLNGNWVDPSKQEEKAAYYAQKAARLEPLKNTDLTELVVRVYASVLVCEVPMTFTCIIGQISGSLGFSDKGEAITTTAEILAVLCETDVFDIVRNDKNMLSIKSNYIDPTIMSHLARTKYLPPMLIPPKTVKNNYDSSYLTVKQSLLLKDNHHEGELCLDHINRMNQIPMSLDLELLKTYSEAPTSLLDTAEKKAAWEKMVKDSYRIYVDLAKQGNRFWLTHRYDKRGRTYCQGYHVSTQGNAFRKAILNFAEEELIEGCDYK